VLLGVEEVRCHQVAGEVVVLDVDRGDFRGAGEDAVLKRRRQVGEGAAEGRDDVLDGELARRMCSSEVPARRSCRLAVVDIGAP
jgi:hypothetical protein